MPIAPILRAFLTFSALGFGATSVGLISTGLKRSPQDSTENLPGAEPSSTSNSVRRSFYQSQSLSDSLPPLPPGNFDADVGSPSEVSPPNLALPQTMQNDSGGQADAFAAPVLPNLTTGTSSLSDAGSFAGTRGLPPPAGIQGSVPGESINQPVLPSLPSGYATEGYGTEPNAPGPTNELRANPRSVTPLPPASRLGQGTSRSPSAAAPLTTSDSARMQGNNSGPNSNWSQAQRALAQREASGQLQQITATEPRRSVPATTVANSNTNLPQESGNLRNYNNRQIQSSQGSNAQTSPSATGFTSGYPYVSPPAGSRYFTTPYNHALFQNAAFQRTYSRQVGSNARPIPANQMTTGTLASTPLAPQPSYQYSAPSIYPTSYQCAPAVISGTAGLQQPSLPPPGAVPGTSVPPTVTANLAPTIYAGNNGGYAPILSLGQEGYNVQLGRGIVGQPTVYVPGQPVRNFLRYLSP